MEGPENMYIVKGSVSKNLKTLTSWKTYFGESDLLVLKGFWGEMSKLSKTSPYVSSRDNQESFVAKSKRLVT